MLLEVCVDRVAGLMAALAGGADRVELCADLGSGGLTPSGGLMLAAASQGVPAHALIRPRPGDFCYGPEEVAVMCADIASARAAGLDGVVIGAASADGRLDLAALDRLVAAADGLSLTLSRVFDLVPDRTEALDQAIGLGFHRILTSGGARSAIDGLPEITRLIARAKGRIVILPGGGIGPANAGLLIEAGALELHASCSRPLETDHRLASFGFERSGDRGTDELLVRALREAMTAPSVPQTR